MMEKTSAGTIASVANASLGEQAAVPSDPNSAPAVDVTAEAPIVTESTSELSSADKNLWDYGTKLATVAKSVTRQDSLDKEAYKKANTELAAGILIGASTLSIASLMADAPAVRTGVVVLDIATMANGFAMAMSKRRKGVQVDNGYALQCIRVANKTSEIADGKVAVAIHPRNYVGDVEPQAFTNERLADALDVVDAAITQDDKRIKHVIIPESLAKSAGLPLEGYRPYEEVVDGITDYAAAVPYAKVEKAVVIAAKDAAKYAEIARADKDALLNRVFAELGNEFPSKRPALFKGNKVLVPVLHGMIDRITSEASGMRTKQKSITKLKYIKKHEDGTTSAEVVEAWDGGYSTFSEDVYTNVNRKNGYNPHITQRSNVTQAEIVNADLRTMTGGVETMMGIVGKLNEKKYDRLQLVRIALQLLEQREENEQTQQEEVAKLPIGKQPKLIELAEGLQPHRNKLRAKFIGRIAATSAGIAAVIALLSAGASAAENADYDSGGASEALPLGGTAFNSDGSGGGIWRIDEDGLKIHNPYWSQDMGHHLYNADQWGDNQQLNAETLTLPTSLPAGSPHITVSVMSGRREMYIPVEEGTQIAAARAFTRGLKPLSVDIDKLSDGRTEAFLDVDNEYYYLQYDLTPSSMPVITPDRPITTEDPQILGNPDAYFGSHWKTGMDDYMSRYFDYDDSDEYAKSLRYLPPGAYADTVYAERKGDDTELNTAAAIFAMSQHPEKNMGIVNGYVHEGGNRSGNHSYIGNNSPVRQWLNDGAIQDAMPRDNPLAGDAHEMRATDADPFWDSAMHQLGFDKKERTPLPWKQYAAMSTLLGVAALELRKRPIRRSMAAVSRWESAYVASRSMDPGVAADLIGWHEYGRRDTDYAPADAHVASPMPDPSGNASGKGIGHIPNDTLQEIADGGFRGDLTPEQRKGLQRNAAALLRLRTNVGKPEGRLVRVLDTAAGFRSALPVKIAQQGIRLAKQLKNKLINPQKSGKRRAAPDGQKVVKRDTEKV